jgi:hypothetical protein
MNTGSHGKGSWIGKPRSERRQSCRRVNSRRDWSGELEESEFHLPFPVAVEEHERGPVAGDGLSCLAEHGERGYVRDNGGLLRDNVGLGVHGSPCAKGARTVSFRDEMQLPKLDTVSLTIGQGLMIDMDETEDVEGNMTMMMLEPSSATTEDSDMTRSSEWTAFSEEAEGIEMLF